MNEQDKFFTVPDDFMEWNRQKQVHYVYRQRVKILRPDVHAQQKKRSSHRSGISGRRKSLRVMKKSISKLKQDIDEAKVKSKNIECFFSDVAINLCQFYLFIERGASCRSKRKTCPTEAQNGKTSQVQAGRANT